MENAVISILLVLVGLIVGIIIMFIVNVVRKNSATNKAEKILERARIDAENIKKGLYNFAPSGMRQKITVKNNITFIEDCYNASPDSMRASLLVLSKHSGRKIAVLGDMFELGEHAKAAHLEVAEFAKNKCDVLFTTGENSKLMHNVFKEAQKESFHFENKEKLSKTLLETLKEGDSVLFKASHGMHFEKIIENIYSALEGEK